MSSFQQVFARSDEAFARRYEYDDSVVLVADLGIGDAAVDVVDDTAIVVTDDDQYEVELPDGAARASMNNGVLTIEVEQ
jgi:hypothetical protein